MEVKLFDSLRDFPMAVFELIPAKNWEHTMLTNQPKVLKHYLVTRLTCFTFLPNRNLMFFPSGDRKISRE